MSARVNHRASIYLTRDDREFDPPFDSIAWALEQHVNIPDTGEFSVAVLHGNEDAPERIEFYRAKEPLVDAPPDFVWIYDVRVA